MRRIRYIRIRPSGRFPAQRDLPPMWRISITSVAEQSAESSIAIPRYLTRPFRAEVLVRRITIRRKGGVPLSLVVLSREWKVDKVDKYPITIDSISH